MTKQRKIKTQKLEDIVNNAFNIVTDKANVISKEIDKIYKGNSEYYPSIDGFPMLVEKNTVVDIINDKLPYSSKSMTIGSKYSINDISYIKIYILTQDKYTGRRNYTFHRTWINFELPYYIIEEMKSKIILSEKKKIETGFLIVFDKESNEIASDRHTEGTRYNIDQNVLPSNEKNEVLGTYHVHPDDIANASIGDLYSAYNDGLKCIGGVKDKKIKCFIRKGDYDKKVSDIIHLYREKYEDPLNDLTIEIKSDIKYRKQINEMFDIYHKKQIELLNMYFNVIEIV